MIVDEEEFEQAWDATQQESGESSEKSVVILASLNEVDSVCATKIAMSLCARTSLPYSVYHVRTYADVRAVVRGVLRGADRVAANRTFLLLNCGASRFVPHEVCCPGPEDAATGGEPPADLLAGVRFVVVDSHRPIHPAYNDPTDGLAVLVLRGDDPVRRDDVPRRNDDMDSFLVPEVLEQIQALAAEEQEEEDAERAAAEARGERWDAAAYEQQRAAKRARTSPGGDGDGDDAAAPGNEAAEPIPTARAMLAQIRARSAELEEYYQSGSSYGAPAALLMHDLAFRRAPAQGNEDLWPAAVGLADQHVHQRLAEGSYERWFESLRAVAAGVEGNDVGYGRLLQQQQLGEDYGGGGGRGGGGGAGGGGGDGDGGDNASVGTGRIFSAVDYRFTLHRHWSLYDAMRTSPYVAPRLQTWRDGGLDRLRVLLVRVGLSLEQARAPFALMRPAERAKVTGYPSALDGACEGTVLRPLEMRYTSFELRYGYGWRCGAADAVLALAATLARHSHEGEAAGGAGRGTGGGGGAATSAGGGGAAGGTGNGGGGANANAAGNNANANEDDDGSDDDPSCPRALGRASLRAASDDFWDALRALDARHGMRALQRGVEAAKALQSAVVSDGGLIVNRRQVEGTSGQGVQVLDLLSVQPTHRDLFRHPLALQRLAGFVRDAADIARAARRDRLPLLAVSPADAKGWCCVTGVRPRPRPSAMAGIGVGGGNNNSYPPQPPQLNLFGPVFETLRREAPELGLRMAAAGAGVGGAFGGDDGAGGDADGGRRQPFDDAVAYVHRDSVQTFVRDVTDRVQRMKHGLEGAAAREAAEAAGLRAKRGGGGAGGGGDGVGDAAAADDQQQQQQQQEMPAGPSSSEQQRQQTAVEAH